LAEKLVISSTFGAAREAEERLLAKVARHDYDEQAVFAIKLALEEGLINAIKHGNGFDPGKVVQLDFEVGPDRTEIRITDQGQGFDPGAVPDPTVDENLEKPCGRGIMLISAYMDEVTFNDRGNQIHMVKRNHQADHVP